FYDENLNKFTKYEGYYTIEHLKNEFKLPKFYKIIGVIDSKDEFLIKIETPSTTLTSKVKKWYKANYESCKLKCV
ncbi:TPA: hypothetical protein RTG66_001533, partial [Campylobacter jejuni]|nr:hypothetical protein [Campylobacter jejuni]